MQTGEVSGYLHVELCGAQLGPFAPPAAVLLAKVQAAERSHHHVPLYNTTRTRHMLTPATSAHPVESAELAAAEVHICCMRSFERRFVTVTNCWQDTALAQDLESLEHVAYCPMPCLRCLTLLAEQAVTKSLWQVPTSPTTAWPHASTDTVTVFAKTGLGRCGLLAGPDFVRGTSMPRST